MTNDTKGFLSEMEDLRNPDKIEHSLRFFKTGPGEYGEGDVFWGLSVPQQQSMAKKWCRLLDNEALAALLRHPVHEVRLTTLLMLVARYRWSRTDKDAQTIVNLYLDGLDYVNNWDLVDSSAPQILGDWCLKHGWESLIAMAKRDHLWTQRVAMLATLAMIRVGDHQPALTIADILKDHPHDLIHKAVGWMLREVGNRDQATEINWLLPRYKKLPRTLLRYAIEKFPTPLRLDFMQGKA